MTHATAELVVAALRRYPELTTVDITGGAPELNAEFRYLVTQARMLGREVIDRCNLTVLALEAHADLPQFLAEQRVHVIASLPCYLEQNVDQQRGRGVFAKSIEVLKALNARGYGRDAALQLDLVYNPLGPSLPPPQAALEQDYKRELQARYGVVFNRLLTITNMPISRFREDLAASGKLDGYMDLLEARFNPAAAADVMCRSLISVGWDGRLYDCDFNQMLEISLENGQRQHVRDFDLHALQQRRIRTGEHCLGCTAGAGSSCGGALK
jgi:radical SAM/Cys-rich protein